MWILRSVPDTNCLGFTRDISRHHHTANEWDVSDVWVFRGCRTFRIILEQDQRAY